jgi:hypothetical protein
MKQLSTMREFLTDDEVGGHTLSGPTLGPQRTILIAAMGETLTDAERAIFKYFTGGRDHEPGKPASEVYFISGRRTAKTRSMGTAATYLGTCIDWSDVLTRGETGVILALAQDQRVATQLLNYVHENLLASPILKQYLVKRTADSIELKNNIRIDVRPASFRKLRGPTYVAIIADELAYWYTDDWYTNTDTEVLAAARPGLMTTRGQLICASSPYAKRGTLWNAFKKHYGPDGSPSVIVAKGTTRELNPNISQEEVDRELERDPERNRSEYLAEFRSDVDSFISIEVVEACVGDYREIAPQNEFTYRLFADSAGGEGQDSFSCSIAHRLGEQTIVDVAREWRPHFNVEGVIDEVCALAKSYRISRIVGDKFTGGVIPQLFRQRGFTYDTTTIVKSDLFHDLLPLLNSKRIVIPRTDRLIAQIVGLERRVGSSGHGTITHAPGGHDDLANAVAGVAQLVFSKNVIFGPDAH